MKLTTSILTPLKDTQQSKKSNNAIVIIGALFFIFGFITWTNSVLIPYLKIACELNNFESYLVAFSFYISYLVMAIPSGWLLNITGLKRGMSAGLIIMAIGALIFIPAALQRTYVLFLLGLFIQGTGLAVLQTASNPYIVILGPGKSAAKRISIMGICNKVAGALAPIILGAITLKNADSLKMNLHNMSSNQKAEQLNMLAHRVILPYTIIIVILVIMSIVILASSIPEIATNDESETADSTNSNKTSILQFPHLILGVITLFVYVGVEVLAGDSVISYAASQAIPLATAKFFTTFTLSGMIVGYIIGIICIPKWISQEFALKASAIMGIILSMGAILTHGYISVLFIALLGFANSMIWPAIWPLAIAELGRFTNVGASLLIMAIAGGAIIPLVYGRLADIINPNNAYWILVPCYLFIFFYGIKGHKLRITSVKMKVLQ